MYGVDEENSVVDEADEYTVHVPPSSLSLSDHQLAQLCETVNPLAESDNFGIELYIQTLDFLRTLVSTGGH